MMKKWSAALKYQVRIIEILLLIISMNLRTSFTCVCYEPAGNMIEKIIVTCGSPMDASGWVEALGKDQAQVTVMNGPSSKSQITQVCSCLLMLGNCGYRSHYIYANIVGSKKNYFKLYFTYRVKNLQLMFINIHCTCQFMKTTLSSFISVYISSINYLFY